MIEIDVDDSLTSSHLSLTNRKIMRILNGQLIKVQGDWCQGCCCDCDYRKPQKWDGLARASINWYGELLTKINSVTDKLLKILGNYFE